MLLINVTNVTNSPYLLACNFVTTMSSRIWSIDSYNRKFWSVVQFKAKIFFEKNWSKVAVVLDRTRLMLVQKRPMIDKISTQWYIDYFDQKQVTFTGYFEIGQFWRYSFESFWSDWKIWLWDVVVSEIVL